MRAGINGNRGRAEAFLARVNLEIVKQAGRRRQGHGKGGAGARAPGSVAGAKVQLRVIQGSGRDPVTPAGYKAAKRADNVGFMAVLPEADPRRRAALTLEGALVRVGSIRGVDLAGGDTKGGISDGGATTRLKFAERLSEIERLANGWPEDPPKDGQIRIPRLALEVKRKKGDRQHIQAFAALVAILSDGADLYRLLRRHGWSAQPVNAKPLRQALLETLDDVADGLGYGRASDQKDLDG